MKELDKVLNQGEKVLWEGTPFFWPFFFSRIIPTTTFGIFWLIMLLPAIVKELFTSGNFISVFLLPHFWIGVFLVLFPTIFTAFVYKHTYYAITDKRVIFQAGVIGRDFQIVDFDQITNAEVNVGVFDKIFGKNTGSIRVYTAAILDNTRHGAIAKTSPISNVANPYEVFKFLKQVSFDVKTDIEYPNKIRPESNPGYQTNLENKEI